MGRLRTALVALAAATALLGQAGPAAAAAPRPADKGPVGWVSGVKAPAAKGPVGWDTYRHLDRLPQLPNATTTRGFSSFDRTEGNGDGFDGTYSCLHTTAAGCVIAEHSGPGEVGAIWFTRDGGDVSKTGDITVELDGKTVLHAPLQDVVDGKLGAPFTQPLVANADQSSGGVLIEVPMPFTRSMKITTEHNPLFYHVSYRTFADADGVRTFDPEDPAADVVDTLKAAGTRDPKPALPGAATTRRPLHLAPGTSQTLAATSTPGLLSALSLTLPQLNAVQPGRTEDDGRAFGAGGHSEFTAAVDPGNTGVTLTRRLDPSIAHQRAAITVDGQPAGEWPANDPASDVWGEQTVHLPAALTAGKSHITVRSTFTSSDLDYNEFRYWVDSTTPAGIRRTDTVDVGNQASETAHQYSIAAQTWSGDRNFANPLTDAQRAELAASQKLLTGLRIRASFDGERTVDAPLGEFFGAGQGLATVDALMYGVDPAAHRLSSWWPMPFAKNAAVQLYNGTDTAVTGSSDVTAAPSKAHAAAVASGAEAPFHATAHAGATTPGEDWTFLDTKGSGKFVGVSTAMRGEANRNYLEGDEKAFADGSRSPQLHGTGTEDFYQSGWYFNRDTYTQPFNGNPNHQGSSTGCAAESDCTDAYRLQIHDAVPFTRSLRYGIEHGPVDDKQADYSSTAFWYGTDRATARTTDTLTLGDARSEQQHGWTTADPAAPAPLTAAFEGRTADPQTLTADVRATRAPVTFTLAVDPKNTGATLRRLSDQAEPGQRAAVTVNGVRLPDWDQPLGNTARRWLDDDYPIPASVSAGHRRLTVTLTPAADAPAWTAASYRADSLTGPRR